MKQVSAKMRVNLIWLCWFCFSDYGEATLARATAFVHQMAASGGTEIYA